MNPCSCLIASLTILLVSLTSTSAAERLVVVAGGGGAVEYAPATRCQLRTPFGAEFAPDGALWIVEMTGGERVLRVDTNGLLRVVAGSGTNGFRGDGGPASGALFNGMHNLAITPAGDVLLADTWNYRIRRIAARNGLITTFAGTGVKGFSGDDGPAAQAAFGSVIQIALDPSAQHLYVADIDNRRVRRIRLSDGVVTTVAGNGVKGAPTDGADARSAPLVDPRAVAVAPDGGFYVLERSGNALRYVDPVGKIRTVAGTGEPGFSGDGGNALQAKLRGPKHLCLDRDGNVIIADTDNHVIRKYIPREGRIERVAGTGRKGSAGAGGPPLTIELNQPHGVTVHRDGTLYITDSHNNRVLKLER